MNNQSSVLNLSNHPDIDDSSLDNILHKIPKKSNIKEINLSKTKITHLPKRETLLLFPNLEKLNLTNTLIQDNQDFISISYELQSIPKLYYLDINISNETDVKIILLSLPLLKEVNGQKVDINNMKITFQEELNLSTYKYICDFMQNLNKNNINFVKNFHDNLSALMNQCLLDINFHCDKYQNNYNLSIFHSLYKINQYLHKGITDYLLLYGDKELDSNNRNNIYNISLQICDTMNFYEGLIRNISTSISIILDKIINENIEQYFKQKTKEVEKNINSKKKILNNEQINKDFQNRTFANFDGNLTYNESMLDNSMNNNKKGNSFLIFDKNDKNDDFISVISNNFNNKNNINNEVFNSKTSRENIKNRKESNDINKMNKITENKKSNSVNSDIIPLNEFLNLINEIYESKEKEEKINLKKNQPRETLEHHIYTFLTRKYGVKHIVIEKAFSIFSSLRKYSNLNSDILLFAKIIRNDIDEYSRLFSIEIKNDLEKFLMNKIIDDDIINIISNSFYCDDNDNKIIFMKKIIEIKKNKENINIDDIYNIILEIEIKKRNFFLKNFKILFKRIDTDSDGIINSYDTSILFGIIFDEIKNELINEEYQIDKNKFVDDLMNYFTKYIPKSLTFSQIVKCLEDSNPKILEYLSKKQNIQENNNNNDDI
jgi:hypothetical protein